MSKANEILAKIKSYHRIIIHRHMNPDPDAIGSQLGLKFLIQDNFPEKEVLASGGPVHDLDFLGEMDEVSVDKYSNALVIVCDTGNTPRISGKDYDCGAFLIKIDHHPDDDQYGDLRWVDTTSSSTCELLTLWAQEVGLTISKRAAQLLYAGIVSDTGRFLYPATTPRTLRLAADLMSVGFDWAALNRKLDSISVTIAKLSAYVFENLVVDQNGAAKVIITQEILKDYQLKDNQTSAIVSLPGKIEEIIAWGIFVEQEDGHYRCRLRSKGPVINEVAKRHDGGGHPLASGANAKDLAEVFTIYQEIQEITQKYEGRKNEFTSLS
ncbi:MAG: bifunctional oligoribonuclease/PAP phosphatase NrnA [Streptococcaceae bacterium]|jgi:phosphoesterase RecJ-like protein|nr:bifunctional oligoribonuclease/PAP phosphatase NrnA [Streptococcaceae bacterium]